jgi:hypothetical protein
MAARLMLAAVATLIALLHPIAATELETTHLFGFTPGSDTNSVAE